MNIEFNDTVFDTVIEDKKSCGYHIFLKRKDLKNFSLQVAVYNLKYALPRDRKLLKVYHDCKHWFPKVGEALLKFRNDKPVILYQIRMTDDNYDTIRITNVSFTICPE